MPDARFNLAKAYQEGMGVKQDKQAAARLFGQLAEKDYPLGIAVNVKLEKPLSVSVDEAPDCEGWLGKQPANAYTVQYISTRHLDKAHRLARKYNLDGYIVCSYVHEEYTLHALLNGSYASSPPGQ